MSERSEQFWSLNYRDLTKRIAGGDPGSPHFETGRMVLEARAAMANDNMARATRWLVWATFALVVMTAVLCVVTVIVAD